MKFGERIDGLQLGRLDEREFEYVGDGPDAVGAPVEEAESVAGLLAEAEAAGVSQMVRERRQESAYRSTVGGLASGARREASPFADVLATVRDGSAAREPQGLVGALGLLSEAARADPVPESALVEDARNFAGFARDALQDGAVSEAFVGELRGLLGDAEAATATRRQAGLDDALREGRGGRRRRPVRRGEFEERLGLLTHEAR